MSILQKRGGFTSLSQSYEERVWKFSFLKQHSKAELYLYIYIIFGKHLLQLYWIVMMCF